MDERKKDIDASAQEIHKVYQDKFEEFAKTVDTKVKGIDNAIETKVSNMNKQFEAAHREIESRLRTLKSSIEEIAEFEIMDIEETTSPEPTAEQVAKEQEEERQQLLADNQPNGNESGKTPEDEDEQ